ncbi:MAG: hypothetical protein U9N07_05165 [Euryarchaeota archaeon]|nr:hypothetical protein [Euryarchaeota archaeon]
MTIEETIENNLKKFSVTAAILFGSFIEKKEYRDIDIMIVLEEVDDVASIRKTLSDIDARIDPSFITSIAFKENISIGNPFYLNVLKGKPIIGREYIERCKEKAGNPSREIIQRYFDLSVHAYRKAKITKEYFDCYVTCKFLIEYLMMREGMYVTDPHRYDSYLCELGLPLNDEDIQVISRILMHRRGDMELHDSDVERAMMVVEKILAL